MYLIVLTGGIASGKTFVAQHLARLGAIHIDADVVAREVVEPGTVAIRSIVGHFGAGVLAADGTIDRRALASIVFSNKEALSILNAITHPAVRRRSAELFEAAGLADPEAIVVYDVPLLAEASGSRPESTDLVVVVHASVATRLQRLVEERGMTEEEARSRIRSQASDEARLALADVVIDTDSGLPSTVRQTEDLWRRAVSSASGKHRA